jgi:long-chain acyl-CoA synthetase
MVTSETRASPVSPIYPADIDWAADIPARPVPAILDDSVARFPDNPCLDFMGRRYSYRRVGELSDRAAAGFRAAGIATGDRVGLMMPNCPYLVIAYFGLLKAGAVVVNFNPLYADHELAHQAIDSDTKAIVTLDVVALHGKAAKLFGHTPVERLFVASLAEQLPLAKALLFRLAKRAEIATVPRDARHVRFSDLLGHRPTSLPPVDPAALAVLQYTGGTTGTPKGAMLTHANLTANVLQSRAWFTGTTPGRERMLGVLPFFHIFAMTVVMNLSIAVGAEIVLVPRFEIDALLPLIAKKRPSFFPAVPTIYTAINNHPQRSRYDLSSIRMCISGGAPLPAEVKSAFEANTGCKLAEGYGLTEASPVACCNPLHALNKPGSIGLPLPRTTIEIVSLEDRTTVLPTGEVGEICIRGPQVMAGYWNKAEETAAVLRDGRLHTGDVGRIDEDGYVFVVDRIKDVIIASGFKIWPRDVEEQIYEHPAVAECIVAGIPDEYRGQTVKAYVVLREGQALDEAGLQGFLRERLSPMAMPRLVEFRQSLPKTLVGKLSRKDVLAEEAARRKPAA